MLGTWREQHLPQIVANLANRPGHESVRALVADILRYGFGVEYHQIDHEVRLPEVHGRVDTLFGSVVFEFKRDLRQEQADVSARLPEYLNRPRATDGPAFPRDCHRRRDLPRLRAASGRPCRDRPARAEPGARRGAAGVVGAGAF
jgi:hypothetical protein